VKVAVWRIGAAGFISGPCSLEKTIGLRLSTLNVTTTCCSNFPFLACVRSTAC
jgi:hypothetical protein